MNEALIKIFSCLVIAAIIGIGIYIFLKLPVGTQRRKIKEWLLWAVTEAEKGLGSGTGQLKLRWVYDLFIDKFKFISVFISFGTFSKWVDEALNKMRLLLESSESLRNFIKDEPKED